MLYQRCLEFMILTQFTSQVEIQIRCLADVILQPRVIPLSACLPFALLDAHVRGNRPIDGGVLRPLRRVTDNA